MELNYTPTPTGERFHACDDRIRGLMGPFGSGKSVACVMEIFKRACMAPPDEKGVRRSRWAVVRNTKKQLEDTTIVTFLEWMPDGVAGTMDSKFNFHMGQGIHSYRKAGDDKYYPLWRLEDGTTVYAEIRFRGLDRPDQEKELLSAEYTGAWFNEYREIPFSLVTAMNGRLRFPKGGVGWKGIIMDSNPPDTESPYFRVFEEQMPDEIAKMFTDIGLDPPKFTIFKQPSGRSAQAENLEHLEPGYYQNMIALARAEGRPESWIRAHVDGEYSYYTQGKAIYQEDYSDDLHCWTGSSLQPMPNIPLVVGVDFGLTPCAIFCQRTPDGKFLAIEEITLDGVGADTLAEKIWALVRLRGWEQDLYVYCDPAGNQKNQGDARTLVDILRAAGLQVEPAPSNSIDYRLGSVRKLLRMTTKTGPVLQIDATNCPTLRKGFLGGYQYRRLKKSGEYYEQTPDKNHFSHIHDAFQYVVSKFYGPLLNGLDKTWYPEQNARARGSKAITFTPRNGWAWGE